MYLLLGVGITYLWVGVHATKSVFNFLSSPLFQCHLDDLPVVLVPLLVEDHLVLVLDLGKGEFLGGYGLPTLSILVVKLNLFSYLLVNFLHFQFIFHLLQVFLDLISVQFHRISFIGVVAETAISGDVGHHEWLKLGACELAKVRKDG